MFRVLDYFAIIYSTIQHNKIIGKNQMMEESIYNIIPKSYQIQQKKSLYKSKYPPTIPPTGSTFCHNTTSKPGVSNLSGDFTVGLQAHTEFGNKSTLGYLKHDRKPSPQHFRKKHTGTMGDNSLPPVRNFSYDFKHKKPRIPPLNQKPVLGLKSNKNFIVNNAIETILSNAKKPEESKNWLSKTQYGQIPSYLPKIKESIENQYRMIRILHQKNQQKKYVLSEQQVNDIREGLKKKWDEINKVYQQITHIRLIDTVSLKVKKQTCERQLKEIQDDIKKLNKAYIFVQ